MVGAWGERLPSVGADPLRNPVQLGAHYRHASACVRARCMLMSQLLHIVSSLAPCLVTWSGAIASVLTRLRASVQALHWRVVVPYGLGDGKVV